MDALIAESGTTYIVSSHSQAVFWSVLTKSIIQWYSYRISISLNMKTDLLEKRWQERQMGLDTNSMNNSSVMRLLRRVFVTLASTSHVRICTVFHASCRSFSKSASLWIVQWKVNGSSQNALRVTHLNATATKVLGNWYNMAAYYLALLLCAILHSATFVLTLINWIEEKLRFKINHLYFIWPTYFCVLRKDLSSSTVLQDQNRHSFPVMPSVSSFQRW